MKRLAVAGLAAAALASPVAAGTASFPVTTTSDELGPGGAGAPVFAASELEPVNPVERVVIGRSVRGRPIRAIRLGDPDGERVALAVGVVHGDERAGLDVLERIPAAELEGVQLWVIPSLNPDGSRTRERGNARGVDLNRNFPFRWRGGVPKSSGYYPGPRPTSEPETRAAMRFIERIDPQVSVWYHQPWGAVLACRGTPDAAVRYAALAGMRTSCRGKGLRGTAVSWQRHVLPGAEAFVVELAAGEVPQRIARRHARALAIIARDGA